MILNGRLFDGKTSAAREVQIQLRDDGTLRILAKDAVEPASRDVNLRDLRISERVGNTMRRLTLSDGATCEITDNDTLDDWLTAMRAHSLEHRVFRLERYWHLALGALAVTVLVSWLFIRYGVPVLAGYAAKAIPPSVDLAIGREGLLLLDRVIFKPSALPEQKQAEIREQFARMTANLNDGHLYRLELRRSDRIGANAFALPSGIVVVTDELVELAQDPREITAVLAHEIGHVVNRHSLRTIIQSSASAALMVALLGDFTSVSNLIAAAPITLIQAKYSRSFETEADDYSYAWLKANDIPGHFLGDLLERLEESHRKPRTDKDGKKIESENDFDFFSSHPRTKDRVRD